MTLTAAKIKEELAAVADPAVAKNSAWFFKTGPGEYGEGDVFIGVRVPKLRKIAKKYKAIPLSEVAKIVKSKIHEHRLTGLILLTYKYEKVDTAMRKEIFDFYGKHLAHVNNWDLVDSSAHKIWGPYMLEHKEERERLYKLVESPNLWERRVAIMTTLAFINAGDYKDTIKIAEMLVTDTEDLIHKAVGWMLREIGKRDLETEEKFLRKYVKKMPRTMLRYAIEKFPEPKRQAYLKA